MLEGIIKQTLAEKIKKTALNTGIRFNIVDGNGYDNASLAMFNEVQQQGLKEDEVEFADIVDSNPKQQFKEPKLVSEGQISYVPRKPRYYNSAK
jgi:Cactus-binding C-terminus of cactin protein